MRRPKNESGERLYEPPAVPDTLEAVAGSGPLISTALDLIRTELGLEAVRLYACSSETGEVGETLHEIGHWSEMDAQSEGSISVPITTIGQERVVLGIQGSTSLLTRQSHRLRSWADILEGALALTNIDTRRERAEVLCHDLGRATHRIFLARTVEELMTHSVEWARKLLGTDVGFWAGPEAESDLKVLAQVGFYHRETQEQWRVPIGGGIGGRVFSERKTVIVRDYLHDPRRIPATKTLLDREQIRSGVIAPIFSGNETIGVLYAVSRETKEFSELEASILGFFARLIATMLEMIQARESALTEIHNLRDEISKAQRYALLIEESFEGVVEGDNLSLLLHPLAYEMKAAIEIRGGEGEILAQGGRSDIRNDWLRSEHRLVTGPHVFGQIRVFRREPLKPLEEHVISRVAHYAVLLFLRNRAAIEAEFRLNARLIDDLLSGSWSNIDNLLEQARRVGLDLTIPRAVVSFAVWDENGGTVPSIFSLWPAVEERARRIMPEVITTTRESNLILLTEISAKNSRLSAVRNSLQLLIDEVMRSEFGNNSRIKLFAGVGRECREPHDYNSSYREALLALQVAATRSTPTAVTIEELGAYGLFAHISDSRAVTRVLDTAVGPLLQADAEQGSDYVRTLAVYLAKNGHLEKTAKFLSIHVNTLRYRLKKIEDLLGAKLDDPDTRFFTELALRVQSLVPKTSLNRPGFHRDSGLPPV